MAKDYYLIPEFKLLLTEQLKRQLARTTEVMVDLQKAEEPRQHMEPGEHEVPKVGEAPHMEPGGHEQFGLNPTHPEPQDLTVGSMQESPMAGRNQNQDLCPVCGMEDAPGKCTCAVPMSKAESKSPEPKWMGSLKRTLSTLSTPHGHYTVEAGYGDRKGHHLRYKPHNSHVESKLGTYMSRQDAEAAGGRHHSEKMSKAESSGGVKWTHIGPDDSHLGESGHHVFHIHEEPHSGYFTVRHGHRGDAKEAHGDMGSFESLDEAKATAHDHVKANSMAKAEPGDVQWSKSTSGRAEAFEEGTHSSGHKFKLSTYTDGSAHLYHDKPDGSWEGTMHRDVKAAKEYAAGRASGKRKAIFKEDLGSPKKPSK